MFNNSIRALVLTLAVAMTASADVFELVTGVSPGTSPGAPRTVFPSSFPVSGIPGSFNDGQRLGGTPAAAPTVYAGTGVPMFSTNQFGSLSFMFRRGSIPITGVDQYPVMAVDYLGGPLLDLDGDLSNGSRRLTPVAGQTPLAIPGSRGFVDLSFDSGAGSVTLNNFDATSNNGGFQGFGPNIAVTVNTIAGTQPNGARTQSINPTVDTRVGALAAVAPGITRIDSLGYEVWQDSLDPASSTAATLGTFQYLGSLRGWRVERDANGDFPALAGTLGTTRWPQVSAAQVGGVFATASGPIPTATITNGVTNDVFSVAGNGGLPLTSYADLGAYLDSVVVPAIDPLSQSFVYLESAGFGINNSFDPVFSDTSAYDMVLVAQSAPIPEPGTLAILTIGALAFARTHRRHDR